MEPCGAWAPWADASGVSGAARGPVETSGRDRLRGMGPGAGDRAGRIVPRRSGLGVASDAPRCGPSGLFRQDVRLAPGIGGSGPNRRLRSGIRRYVEGGAARSASAACRQNHIRGAGPNAVHSEQHSRNFLGYRFGDLPVASARPGCSLRKDFRDACWWRLCASPWSQCTGGGR